MIASLRGTNGATFLGDYIAASLSRVHAGQTTYDSDLGTLKHGPYFENSNHHVLAEVV